MDDELIIMDEGMTETEEPSETAEAVIDASQDQVIEFVNGDLPQVFLIGFTAGIIIISLVYAIRVVARLFSRILKS